MCVMFNASQTHFLAYQEPLYTPFSSQLDLATAPCGRSWSLLLQNGASDKKCNAVCTLFSTSLNPLFTAEQKNGLIEAHFSRRHQGELDQLFVFLVEQVPPVMSTHIFLYFSERVRQDFLSCLLAPSRDQTENAITFLLWIQEVLQNDWQEVTKNRFIDILLSAIPDELKERMLAINDHLACEALH